MFAKFLSDCIQSSASFEDFDQDKCSKATKLADDWIQSLRNLANINWASGVVLAAVIIGALVGMVTVPFATIPLLLFTLTANIGITAFLLELVNQMEANKDDIICGLYTSGSVDAAVETMGNLLNLLIVAVNPPAGIGVALVRIALWLLSGDTLNYLFTSAAKGAFPNATCTCAEDFLCWTFDTDLEGWSVSDQSGGTVEITWQAPGVMHLVTGSPSDFAHTIFEAPTISYLVQPGDEFIFNFTVDPVPYGMLLWITAAGVRTLHSFSASTIVDHILCTVWPLTFWEGQTITRIEVAVNKAGGGTWDITQAGLNCTCP
jgi:hypothetical protein